MELSFVSVSRDSRHGRLRGQTSHRRHFLTLLQRNLNGDDVCSPWHISLSVIQISNKHPEETFPLIAVKLSWALSRGLCWVFLGGERCLPPSQGTGIRNLC